MSKTYLFFDIEYANCFNNEGKICSFGYVLSDSEFNVIKSDDIVINPNTEFDPYLFQKNSTCKLAYKKEEFLAQPFFNNFYDEIKELFTAPDRIIMGFGLNNDIEFLICECVRYHLDVIPFTYFDIHNSVVKLCEKTGGLDFWVDYFNIDKTKIKLHKSVDDALATMMVVQELCKQKEMSLEEVLQKSAPKLDTEISFESYKKSLYKNVIKAKIQKLLSEPVKQPQSDILRTKNFHLLLNKKTDAMVKLEIIKDIVNNGGHFTEKLTDSCLILAPSPRERPDWLRKCRNKIVYLNDVYTMIKKPCPRIYNQQPLPEDFDYKKAQKELARLRQSIKK